jgi:hypothetical protein
MSVIFYKFYLQLRACLISSTAFSLSTEPKNGRRLDDGSTDGADLRTGLSKPSGAKKCCLASGELKALSIP